MEKSVKSMLNRRASLLHRHNQNVPSQHETITKLGDFLGQTILSSMSPLAKKLMGVETQFPVPPKTLWISPSDRVDCKIMLTPPPNIEVIKALTHEGILEIGSMLERKVEEDCESKLKVARKEVEDFERFEFLIWISTPKTIFGIFFNIIVVVRDCHKLVQTSLQSLLKTHTLKVFSS